ncbi:MAG: hypothetical protein WC100_10190 [Sterolibacterium sp.]
MIGLLAMGVAACGGGGGGPNGGVNSAAGISVLAGSLGTPGNTDGTGTAARFEILQGIATDNLGNLYVANSGGGGTIRKITSNGVTTTLLGSLTGLPSIGGGYKTVHGLGIDNAAGVLVYTNTDYYVVKNTFPLDSGVRTSYAMDGWSFETRWVNLPTEMTLDSAGNVYVAMGYYIRKLDPVGHISTLAGLFGVPGTFDYPRAGSADGVGTTAGFDGAYGVTADSDGNVYVADSNNKTVRKITPNGVVITMAGQAGQPGADDGVGAAARFNHPRRLAVDRASNVYVVDTASTNNDSSLWQDTGNSTIRKITPDGRVTTVAGQAAASGGTIPGPLPGTLGNLRGIVVGTDGALYVNTFDAVLKIVLPTD